MKTNSYETDKIWSQMAGPQYLSLENAKMCFSPRGSILSFEGGILLSISLGLAVRIFRSDLEKFPKSASGEILEGSGQHFGLGTFLANKIGDPPKNTKSLLGGIIIFWRGSPADPQQNYDADSPPSPPQKLRSRGYAFCLNAPSTIIPEGGVLVRCATFDSGYLYGQQPVNMFATSSPCRAVDKHARGLFIL